ncbi:uncharacterized protein [Clytia hemisphaerica]|uniref:uncharacterized protein n=1 Tax=Clytia hemisphaerica TaxID=252671 RepID=UPI0034D7A9F4
MRIHRRWEELYPNLRITEQRICDQQRQIVKKSESNENLRGNWLTQLEINQIRLEIQQLVTNENLNQDEAPNNEAEEENNPQLPNNVPEERADQPRNEPEILNDNENHEHEQEEIRRMILEEYARTIITPLEERKNIQKPSKKKGKSLEKSIGKVNEALEGIPLLTDVADVTNLDHLVYASAVVAIERAQLQKECLPKKRIKTNKKTDWTFKMQKRIDDIRADISRVSQMVDPNPSPKMKKNSNSMKNKYNIQNDEQRITTLEKLKQRLLALNNRLSRYQKRQKQFQQNRDFTEKPSKLYDQLRGNRITISDPPEKEAIKEFWKPLYGNRKEYNKNALWLDEYKGSTNHIIQAEYTDIEPKEIAESSSKFANWKSPGIDNIQNYWWNKLKVFHNKTAQIMNSIVKNPETCPQWLTTGRTTLVPKKVETRNPSNYRPITCLPIVYKILTSIITSRMLHHIQANSIIPVEQKGNASNTYGTIDQLMINKLIMVNAKNKLKNISTAWIDYKKAYDSVPHDWIIDTLKIHKFDKTITSFFESTMTNWQTSLTLNHDTGLISTNKFSINTGIYQGDCPSGTLFILSLLPLSWLLKESKLGYRFNKETTISHLLFMDDLKLYAANDQQLNNQIKLVKTFSDDIQMNFGIEKCNKVTIKRGKITKSDNIVLDNGEILKTLDQNKQYKYLGFNEHQLTDKYTKSALKNEYFKRLKMLLKSELNSLNTISAINSYAVPALSYGFPVLDWTITKLENIDRETRKVLQSFHVMHNQSDVTRLYLPRKEGGRGLINIVDHFKNCIINFSSYLLTSNEPYLTLLSNWQLTRGAKSIHAMAQSYSQEISLEIQQLSILSKSQRKSKIKIKRIETRTEILKAKNLHGQYFQLLDEPHVDKTLTTDWIRSSTLKRATEATVCAIQEQAVTTRYIQRRIFHQQVEETCRICNREKETIHYIISGCTVLAPTKYLQRHNNLCKYIHELLMRENDLKQERTPWYEHQPHPVEENESTKILWDFSIQTDHQIDHNKPDIVVLNKQTKEALIIDIAIPSDYNIPRKRIEKIRNYTDLAVELKTLWNLNKVKIVPIIIGATGVIHKGLSDDVGNLGLTENKFNISEAQKITLLGTAHVVRSFFTLA